MKYIEKIKLHNFGKFRDLSVKLNTTLKLLIGDNEAGKSTVLFAIDLVLSGSRSKIESIGLDNLFNSEIITNFLKLGEKKIENLPTLYVELYLNDQNNKDLEGRNNISIQTSHGLYLLCEPRIDLSKEIKDILEQNDNNFSFEYYSIIFKTFSGDSYTGNRKFMKYLLLDNTQINNKYATKLTLNK